MDIYKKTIELCKIYNIVPKRSKGQNFLISKEIYDKIIESADLKKDDVVLEVGPGLGFLTEKLAKKVKKVVAVELDNKLCDVLRGRLKEEKIENVEVVNDDILQTPNHKHQITNKFQFLNSKYKIVANLPYNITSIFLRRFLSGNESVRAASSNSADRHSSRHDRSHSGRNAEQQRDGTYALVSKPEQMVLMIQKEVAERIVARPRKMSLLAVSVQFYSEPEILGYVGKENFWPMPGVDSAIVKINIKSDLPALLDKQRVSKNISGSFTALRMTMEKKFFQLVKFGFSAKRKMLKNNLAAGFNISQAEAEKKIKKVGLLPKIRAQELAVNDWVKLFGEFKENMV